MEKTDNASQTIKGSKNPMQESNPESIPEKTQDSENLQEIIKKIEKDGVDMLNKLQNTGNVNCDSLTNLMKTGEDEFIKKTGRGMTYAEIRQAYG